MTDRGIRQLFVWSGPAATAMVLLGWVVIAGFIPPQAPSASAAKIADYYADNATQLRIGMVFAMIGFTLLAPFGIAIAEGTRRLGEERSLLSSLQIACVAIGVVEGVISCVIWATAAFRPAGIDPEITRALNDLGWFSFLFDVPPFTVWIGAIALAILRDDAAPPAFPRWLAWFNLWVAFLILPADLIAFFKHGPFGFNGLLALYLPAGLFFAWVLVMSGAMLTRTR